MENAFSNILFGVLGNFGFFILGLVLNKFVTFLKQRGKNKIWKMFSRKKIIIALSIRSGPLPTSTPRVSIAEVIALIEILPIFRNLKIDIKLVDNYSDVFLQNYDNLLSIGGPSVNHFTEKILKKYEKKLPIKMQLSPVGFEIGNKKYETIYSDDKSKIKIDYAIVFAICDNSEEGKAKNIMVIMGCRGYGTQGGVSSISSRNLINKYKRYRNNKSFIAVIKIEFDENGLQHTTVVDFYPLRCFQLNKFPVKISYTNVQFERRIIFTILRDIMIFDQRIANPHNIEQSCKIVFFNVLH